MAGGEKQRISYCAVCDGFFYKDKVVAVVGGGDTALGDALYLSKLAKLFTLSTDVTSSEQIKLCRKRSLKQIISCLL